VALVGEESVSRVTGASRRVTQENPVMRIYVIGNDGIRLCREPPAAVNEGEIVVGSNKELRAAPLNGKRLLALWNALPGVEKRKRVGGCGRRSRHCRIPSRQPKRSVTQSKTR
jgi:hypothetical protein